MTNMTPIKIYLIDNSELIFAGFNWLFSQNEEIKLVGYAKSLSELRTDLRFAEADIVLLDISIEMEYDGLEVIRYAKFQKSDIKIIVLSHYKTVNYIVKSIKSGASAYIAKDTSLSDLITNIKIVMNGKGFSLGETLSKSDLLDCLSEKNNNLRLKPWNLSDREIGIIRLLSKGMISKQISDILNINVSTVESHKEHIKQKLKCQSIIEVIVFALKYGLVD